jgi:hypothetical protein
MKQNARVIFRVEKISGGEPWIRLEPIDKDLRILGSGFLGFELPEGTTIQYGGRDCGIPTRKY